jgi:CheY-like chemotaxis protein
MDIVMPRMDGLEATRRIRRDRTLTPQPRIVGMSEDSMPEDQDICITAGMDDFLLKPIAIAHLARILDEAAVGLSAV